MNIFEYAMTFELDGESYYREIAQQNAGTALAGVFDRLAGSEHRHYEVLQTMRDQADEATAAVELNADAENIFSELKAQAGSPLVVKDATDPVVAAYRKAQELEQGSMDYYTAKAEEVSSPGGRKLLLELADEEKKHYWILDNIVKHVSRPDFGWIEFAEWSHQEEY